MGLSRPLTDRHQICTQVWCAVKAENLLSKIILPTPKNLAGKIYYGLQFAYRIDKEINSSSLAASLTIKRKRLMVSTCRLSHLSVCRSVYPESVLWQIGWLDPDAVWDGEWVEEMGVLDGVEIVEGEGAGWIWGVPL